MSPLCVNRRNQREDVLMQIFPLGFTSECCLKIRRVQKIRKCFRLNFLRVLCVYGSSNEQPIVEMCVITHLVNASECIRRNRCPLLNRAGPFADRRTKARDCFGIWSSEQAHTVDALAAGGEEGRWSLRKASGSRQPDCEPEMSEWGNPLAQASIPYLNT